MHACMPILISVGLVFEMGKKKNIKINMVWVIIDISLCLLCNGVICADCKASFRIGVGM